MSDKEIKVLAVGDVNGRFDLLLKRLTAINKNVSRFSLKRLVFRMARSSSLCARASSSVRTMRRMRRRCRARSDSRSRSTCWVSYSAGILLLALHTDSSQDLVVFTEEFRLADSCYIAGPCCPSTSVFYPETGVEFSPNLTFLGKRGVLHTAWGLTIGYLSGVEGPESNAFQFVEDDVDDLLLPIRTQSGFLGVDILLTSSWPAQVAKHSSNQPSKEIAGSKLVSRLAAGLKPRYHFAGMGTHYERSPYR